MPATATHAPTAPRDDTARLGGRRAALPTLHIVLFNDHSPGCTRPDGTTTTHMNVLEAETLAALLAVSN